jgi:hypothetical protein
MSELVHTNKGSHYTDEQRYQAAIEYAVKGNMAKVSKALGIPESTLCNWKKETWWDEQVAVLPLRSCPTLQLNRLLLLGR